MHRTLSTPFAAHFVSASLCCVLALSSLESTAAEANQKRRFEVRDAVEMAYFGTIASSQRDHLPDDGIVSPDGRYIVKVTHRGMLPEGVTEGTIWLFETKSVRDYINDSSRPRPEPVPLARISAAVNGITGDFLNRDNTISALAWSADSKALTFLGRDHRENRRIFRLDVASRELKALTPESQDVVVYGASRDRFAYLAAENIDAEQLWQSAGGKIPDIEVGVGKTLIDMLYPNMRARDMEKPLTVDVWQIRDGKAEPVIDVAANKPLRIRASYNAMAASLSPSGSQLATVSYANADAANKSLHYAIIDLDSGAAKLLTEATASSYQYRRVGRLDAAWSADESTIALSELRFTREGKASRCIVGIASLRDLRTECVMPSDPKSTALPISLRWLANDRLYVRRKTFGSEEYRDDVIDRVKTAWRAPRPADRNILPSVRFTVRESLNERPVLMATDLRNGKQRMLFDPNPQLDAVDLGTMEIYEWRDASGRTLRGGLLKPPQFQTGRRYPLVVQTHGFNPNQFYRIGDSDTVSAGRALAGRDIMVLQVREPNSTGESSWRDAEETGVQVYLGAIDQLAAAGMIDPNKVGISGYSYTGWTTAASIVRAPDRFAAAVIGNTDPITITGYFAGVDSWVPDDYERVFVGAAPFGEGLELWKERVPSLASDKIKAAVLFAAADPWHLIGTWDLYAAMRRQHKPVELQYIRSGQHVISKPLHKLAHQELIVDWFEFWLADREREGSRNSDRYASWRELKKAQRAGS